MARAPKAETVSQSKALVNWEEEMEREAAIAQGQEANTGGGQFFSVKGGILAFDGSPVPNNQMAVIVLDSILENDFYEGAYDPNNAAPPTCYAFGRDETTMGPHPDIVARDQAQHETCQGCPMNAYGTANTGKGKACSNRRRLALVPAGQLDKDGNFTAYESEGEFAKSAIGYLKLNTMSLKGWANYVKTTAATLKRPPYGVFTLVKVVPDPKSQFRLIFESLGPVDRDLLQVVSDRNKEAKAQIEQPYNLDVEDAPAPAAKPAARRAVAPAAPANKRPEVKKPSKKY